MTESKNTASHNRTLRQRALSTLSILLLLLLPLYRASAATPSTGEKSDAAAGSDMDTIKIGFITSLTGPASRGGVDMVNGFNLYLDQVHDQIAGHNVKLIVEDDQSQQSVAAAKLRKLVETDKVNAVSGIILSNIALFIAPLVDTLETPMVFSIPNADDITQRRHTKWAIRLSSSSSQSSHAFGEWARKHLHYKRVVTFGLDYALGWEGIGGFQTTFEQGGGQVVQKIWAPLFAPDYSEWIKKIRPDADALYMAVAANPSATVHKQYKELGGKLPVIGIGQGYDDRTLDSVGNLCLGEMSALHYSSSLNTPNNQRFVQAYRAKYPGVEPSHFSEAGYVSAMWIAKAAESLKGNVDNRAKLMAALKTVQLPDAPRGPMKLDSYGNPIENIYILRVDNVNGRYQNAVIDTYKSVSQFWKLKPEEYLQQPPYRFNSPSCKFCTDAPSTNASR